MDFLKEWEEKLNIKITCSQVRRLICLLASAAPCLPPCLGFAWFASLLRPCLVCHLAPPGWDAGSWLWQQVGPLAVIPSLCLPC